LKVQNKWPPLRSRRLPKPGEIAAWSKTYWTSFERRPANTLELSSNSDIPKSLRRRSTEKPPPPFFGPFGSWAVDAVVNELFEWFAQEAKLNRAKIKRRHAKFPDAVIAMRCEVWSAFEKANDAVKPLKRISIARQRLRESLRHLDDLIVLLDRGSTADTLHNLPSALTQLGDDGARWTRVISALATLPQLRCAAASAAKRDLKRGSKGTPFEDAFVRELVKIWRKLTRTLPPKMLKEAKFRRGVGHLFYKLVDAAFSDVQQSKSGLTKRIRRVVSSIAD
jgi:hypothetical protein